MSVCQKDLDEQFLKEAKARDMRRMMEAFISKCYAESGELLEGAIDWSRARKLGYRFYVECRERSTTVIPSIEITMERLPALGSRCHGWRLSFIGRQVRDVTADPVYGTMRTRVSQGGGGQIRQDFTNRFQNDLGISARRLCASWKRCWERG